MAALSRRVAALLLGLAVAAAPAAATEARPSEAAVKAAYLFKFLAYVDWPPATLPAPERPLVIAVAAADAVLEELRSVLPGRSVNGHAVVARRLADGDTLDDVHALFVGRTANHGRILGLAAGRPVLVVTENGLDGGAMLSFVPVAGRVRFEAAPQAAERAGLKLGARLLAVAERVVAP